MAFKFALFDYYKITEEEEGITRKSILYLGPALQYPSLELV